MATMHQTQSEACSKFIQTFPPQCRVIVDDVDEEDRLHPVNNNERSHLLKTESDCDVASSRDNPTARIKQIQVEAESRKIEFARLLEEHAQVIRRLKQMEESESIHHIQNPVASATKA